MNSEGYPFHITTSAWRQIFKRRNELIQQFRWHPELQSAVDRQMAELKTEHSASVVVGVHVRMTDYYIYLIAYYGSFRQADSAFFTRAMNHFRFKYAKPVFLVISNDVNWCKDHLEGDDIVYPGEGDEDDPGWDLAILASCDHLILTYGTFGYMAAWFKGPAGEVLVADNYTSKPEKMFERLKAADPPNWTYLST